MSTVADILASKGGQVFTIESDATVLDAVRKMVESRVGSLIVTDGEKVLGIFTERDYLCRIVLEGRTSDTTPVVEVTSERLVCIDPGEEVDECMAIMTQERIRHLPVIDQGGLVGVISIGDLVKQVSRERKSEIRYLTDYIAGKYPG